MDRRKFIIHSATGALGSTLFPTFSYAKEQTLGPGYFTTEPRDTGKALVNPDMGWTMHFYSNIITNYGSKLEPSDTLDDFPGLSTVYLRIPWSFIEPEEGKFKWEILDTPAQRWIEKGKRVAFRISAEESWMTYATPEWVKNAGAKGYEVKMGVITIWEPKFDDAVFLEKVENFVAAMAERYDGRTHVDFVDVGHFGLWGEGHTHLTGQFEYPLEIKKKHIDIYLKHFKSTLLCISDDFAGSTNPRNEFPITDYAFSKGVTIRDDSILVHKAPQHWYHAGMAQKFWPEFPVILEHQHYGASLKAGAWDKDLFLQSIEEYHASYMSIHWWPRIFLDENRDVIDQINLRMGYRLQLKSISWPKKVKLGEPFEITQEWANAGVAPCYPGGFPCVTLKDEKGGIVSVLTAGSLNVKELQVAKPQEEIPVKVASTFTIAAAFDDPVKTFFRVAKPGKYDVFVSVGQEDGTPVFELPYNNNDGYKRYKMGQIEVAERN
ncbi:DUF4832 domain-containing protein [Mariniphaga sediminis]|uniref:DUF4832 domain-containing protein n=1 Tax=Mariniphaga sediminis TaxID=1628158 RepID=UPI003566BDDA